MVPIYSSCEQSVFAIPTAIYGSSWDQSVFVYSTINSVTTPSKKWTTSKLSALWSKGRCSSPFTWPCTDTAQLHRWWAILPVTCWCLGQYQMILLDGKCIRMWTTRPELLADGVTAWSWACYIKCNKLLFASHVVNIIQVSGEWQRTCTNAHVHTSVCDNR